MTSTINEEIRLKELRAYGVMNTAPEREYDYIVELASAICNTPISLINIVGDKTTWFKAKLGLPNSMTGSARDVSFCSHTLDAPNETLLIKDTLADPRFATHPYVVGDPNIRFYAGSPLVTPSGNVIGALCVIDHEPRELTDAQIMALETLSKKVMDNLETKKIARENKEERDYLEQLLKKVSDRAPGAIYKFIIDPSGQLTFPFVSNGLSKIYPNLSARKLMKDGNVYFRHIHPEDLERVQQSLYAARDKQVKWDEEYRVKTDTEGETWHRAIAIPEVRADGQLVWFGTFQDTTRTRQYIAEIEHQNQILFEIAWEQSHVVRAPLARIMALINTMANYETDEVNKELLGHIGNSATQLDNIIRGIVSKSEALKSS